MITQTHKTCEFHSVEIDWDHTNKDGLPAIVCEQCKNTKGKRRGKAKWVSWLSRKDLYKIQFGADWESKYAEYQYATCVAVFKAKQRSEKDIYDGGEREFVPGNYDAYTG
tara:strand:+ start:189 stop:518 length:330 start_codon:yes stop_codon:yes gene_type:complete